VKAAEQATALQMTTCGAAGRSYQGKIDMSRYRARRVSAWVGVVDGGPVCPRFCPSNCPPHTQVPRGPCPPRTSYETAIQRLLRMPQDFSKTSAYQ